MITFKQFLREMPQRIPTIDHNDKYDSYLDDNPIKPPGKHDHEEEHGYEHPYSIKSRRYVSDNVKPSETKPHTYMAHHDDTDTTHMVASGGTTKDNYFRIRMTRKHSDSEVSGAEFYKHILAHGEHAGIESDIDHTEGGEHIWKKLSHEKNVSITRHNAVTGEKLKMHKDWDKNYEDGPKSVFRLKLKNGK